MEDGRDIGRIYRTIGRSDEGHIWHWSIYTLAMMDAWKVHVHGGRAATLEEAQAAFKAAWATCERRPPMKKAPPSRS